MSSRWRVLVGFLAVILAGRAAAGEDELRARWKNARTLDGGFQFVCAHTTTSNREMRYGVGSAPLVGPALRRNRANTALGGQFHLEQVHVERDTVVFEGPFEGEGSIHDEQYADSDFVATDDSGGRMQQRTHLQWDGGGTVTGTVSLVVDLAAHTYSLDVEAGEVPATVREERWKVYHVGGRQVGAQTPAASSPIELGFTLPSVADRPLPEDGLALSGRLRASFPENIAGSPAFPMGAPAWMRWHVGVRDSEEPRLWIEPIDVAWLPEPDRQVTTRLRWEHGEPDELVVRLEDVGREPGDCLNDKPGMSGTEPDLAFAERMGDLGYEVKQVGEDAWEARTEDPGKTGGQIVLDAKDYAAYGRLRARARIHDTWIEAQDPDSGLPHTPVPRDDDGNHVADGWEREHGMFAEAPTWDEDPTPEGQRRNGDAITYFEEYRGFYVLGGGGRTHVRTNPTRKELFYVDESRLLDAAAFERSSGIRALRVDKSMLRGGDVLAPYRQVDFQEGFAAGGQKYATYVFEAEGMLDKEHGSEVSTLAHSWLNAPGGTPKDCDYIRIFVDRIDAYVRRTLYDRLRNAVADPTSADAQEFERTGLPPALAKKALDAYHNETAVSRVVEDLTALIVVHEMGHACGADHHGRDDASRGVASGETSCPMRYAEKAEWLTMVVLEVLFPQKQSLAMHRMRFCRAEDDCWSQLDVRDE